MAQTALRLRLHLHLRRAVSLSTALLHHSAAVNSLHLHTPLNTSAVPRRHFHSSLSVAAPRSFDDIDKIDPDTILFEGCDYKHWLIVMDFGKDLHKRPTPDQMVETYVQTAAQVLGSVAEAKRKIYACSTTTYTGFQVEVDEETSKKFEGLPGVIFVLPDSYIDPANKEYGGDKYINGEIIPRPPPVQYGRTNRGYRTSDQRPPSHNQQRNPAYNQPGPMPQGGRGYTPSGPQQGFPQQQNIPPPQSYPPKPPSYAPQPQNYGPPGQADRGPLPGGPQYSRGGVGGYQGGQGNFVPPQQGNYNYPQGPMSNAPGNHRGPLPPGQYRSDSGDHGVGHPQGQRGTDFVPSVHNQANIPPPVTGAYGQTGGRSFPQNGAGQGPDGKSFGPGAGYPPLGGNQRYPPTSYEQSNPMGTPYNQARPSGNNYGHGAGYPPLGENQRFPPMSNEQGNPMEPGNYPPGTQTGFDQRRY